MGKRKLPEPSVDQVPEVRVESGWSTSESEKPEVNCEELAKSTQPESHTAALTHEEGECLLTPLTTPGPIWADDPDSGPFWDLLALA